MYVAIKGINMVRDTYQQAPSEEISLQRRRGGENTGGERREERRGAKVPFLCILSLNGSNLILICNFIVVSLKQKRKKKIFNCKCKSGKRKPGLFRLLDLSQHFQPL